MRLKALIAAAALALGIQLSGGYAEAAPAGPNVLPSIETTTQVRGHRGWHGRHWGGHRGYHRGWRHRHWGWRRHHWRRHWGWHRGYHRGWRHRHWRRW